LGTEGVSDLAEALDTVERVVLPMGEGVGPVVDVEEDGVVGG